MLIYIIENRVNGKVYIGQHRGDDVQARLRGHFNEARRGAVQPLYRAIRKYGQQSFAAYALSTYASSQEDLDAQEIFYIAKYRACESKFGYNLLPGGIQAVPSRPFQSRAKIRVAKKGRPLSPSHRRAIGDAIRGKTRKFPINLSEQHRRKIGKSSKRAWDNATIQQRKTRLAKMLAAAATRKGVRTVRYCTCGAPVTELLDKNGGFKGYTKRCLAHKRWRKEHILQVI